MSFNEQQDCRLELALSLRVIATFVVVFGHSASFFNAFSFTQWPQFPYIQSVAVTLFFALSGFTIAWVCDRSSGCGIRGLAHFTYDRFMRLAIPLFPVLILFTALEVAFVSPDPYIESVSTKHMIGNLLFLQGLTFQVPLTNVHLSPNFLPLGINRPLWTLSIEFWCYVTFASAFFASRASAASRVLLVLCCFIGLTLLIPPIGINGLPLVWAAGAALYFILKILPAVGLMAIRIASVALLASALTAAIPATWPADGQYSYLFNSVIFCAFAGSMIIASAYRIAGRAKSIILWFSSYAYTVYLVHYPVLFLLRHLNILHDKSISAVFFGVISSFSVAWLLYWPFERRYRDIRDNLWKTVTRSSEDKRHSNHARYPRHHP